VAKGNSSCTSAARPGLTTMLSTTTPTGDCRARPLSRSLLNWAGSAAVYSAPWRCILAIVATLLTEDQSEYVASILSRCAELPGLMWDLDNIPLVVERQVH
jgi:hypothetical protein